MLLRPRQTKFVARAVAALRERGNTLAVAPTGFGKTIALAAIIGRLLASGGRALVLQHRQELVSQNVAKFQIVNPSLPVSVVDAGAKDFSGRAIFAMVPTLARPRTLGMLPVVDVVVIDEAHHATAKTYRRIIDRARELNPEAMILGLTATPRRGDKKTLQVDGQAFTATVGFNPKDGSPRELFLTAGKEGSLLNALLTAVRTRLSPRLSGAMSNGTPARARETKRGTENDLLRRLLHRPALVDDYPLELTEALYEAGLIKFTDANGGAINMLLTEKGHQIAIGSSSKRGDPRGPSHPPRYPPSPESPLGAF